MGQAIVEHSLIILSSVPIFAVMMVSECLYGIHKQKKTYRLNDTLCSLTLGILSRFPAILNLAITSLVYATILKHFKPTLVPIESWMTWVVAFLLYDFCYYWQHRLSHERTLLWASHVVHHQSEDYNLGTALRQTSTSFLFSWIFYVPMFLLGVPLTVFFTIASINLIYQFWVHTEHIGKLGFLEQILVTPSNHRVHHACNKGYIDSNYGGVFILWDRMFGTFADEKAGDKPIYGTLKPLRSWNPVWANLEVYHQMIHDTWHTECVKDKLRVWVSRTGWRPKDVQKRFPLRRLNTLNPLKYETMTPMSYQVFAVLQFIAYTLIAFFVIITQENQTEFEIALFAIVIAASAGISSGHLDRRKNSIWAEFVRSTIVLALLFLTPLWNLEHIAAQILLIHAMLNILLIPMLLNFTLAAHKFAPAPQQARSEC